MRPQNLAIALTGFQHDHGGMSELEEGRCKHGEIADWCGESECMAARKGVPRRVWRTAQGQAYHRKKTCTAMQDGQSKAQRFGKQASPPEQVPLSVAMSAGLGECYHCFPPDVPPDAKPCQVLIAGKWVDGFLLEWRRGPDGRWLGRVNYRWQAGRKVVLKDQSQLRPDPPQPA